nr:MAG TPA: hypothetical protein [Microviridae sp.]
MFLDIFKYSLTLARARFSCARFCFLYVRVSVEGNDNPAT